MSQVHKVKMFLGLFALATVCSSSLYAIPSTTVTAARPIVTITCTKPSTCSTPTSYINVDNAAVVYKISVPTVPWLLATAGGTSTAASSDSVNNTASFTTTSAWTTLTAGLYKTTVNVTIPSSPWLKSPRPISLVSKT
jgi:hypothetical protein